MPVAAAGATIVRVQEEPFDDTALIMEALMEIRENVWYIIRLLEVDGEGLERTDRELLRAIVERFGGGPVGLSTLAVALGEEPDTIEDVYEPYLLQLGFIQRTPCGRIVTDRGRDHLGAEPERETRLF